MVTLDTSAVVALLAHRDKNHAAIVEIIRINVGNLIIPVPVLSEIAHFVERDLGSTALVAFLADIRVGRFQLDCCENDWTRITDLVQKFADFPLGLSDATVIACAERHGGAVATFDLRHFGVVARAGTIDIVP